MKKVTFSFSILALSSAFIVGCDKKANVAPEPDTEVQSAVYASWATYVATDIEMACSFMAENNYNYTFYSMYPGSNSGTTGTVNVIRDTTSNPLVNEDQLVMAWNNTKCMDGNMRHGSIFMNVPQKNNQRYARDPKFVGYIRFSDYKINGWLINLTDPLSRLTLSNTVVNPAFNPATTNITWSLAGKLTMKHPTDPSKDMLWEGKLVKTLMNTSTPTVFPVSKQGAINWFKAVVKYHGTVTGTCPQTDDKDVVLASNVPYKMVIDEKQGLIRDFTCSPDKVTGVVLTPVSGSLAIRGDEHHPFKAGVAEFTISDKYPRQVYYGNEGEPTLLPQCDNTGEVMIKGISYRINFMR